MLVDSGSCCSQVCLCLFFFLLERAHLCGAVSSKEWNVLPKNTTLCACPGLESGQLIQELPPLTMRALHLPYRVITDFVSAATISKICLSFRFSQSDSLFREVCTASCCLHLVPSYYEVYSSTRNTVYYSCPRFWYPVYWICIEYKDCVYNCWGTTIEAFYWS